MPGAPTFDLQSHSTVSDGVLEPAEVVARAAANGVELLALTDHDAVDGVEEAQAAARRHGIRLSPAVEVSAVAEEGSHPDVHVVGYEVDPAYSPFTEALAGWRDNRAVRAQMMADRLRDLGFELDEDALATRRAQHRPIGRPHLYRAVLAVDANQARLRAEGTLDQHGFFARYLVPGALAFVPRTRPTVAEAIAAIHGAGGVAVWAHPFWDVEEPGAVRATLDRFLELGLDGVEAFYRSHDKAQTLLLHDVAVERDLLATGSTDFHRPADAPHGGFRGFELHGREPRLGPIGR